MEGPCVLPLRAAIQYSSFNPSKDGFHLQPQAELQSGQGAAYSSLALTSGAHHKWPGEVILHKCNYLQLFVMDHKGGHLSEGVAVS